MKQYNSRLFWLQKG